MAPDPEQIQREIEATRAELAASVSQIVERLSPATVKAQGKELVKEKVGGAVGKARDSVEGFFAPASGDPTAAPVPLQQRVKWDRVGGVVGGLVVVTVGVRSLKGRSPQSKSGMKKAGAAAKKAQHHAGKAQLESIRRTGKVQAEAAKRVGKAEAAAHKRMEKASAVAHKRAQKLSRRAHKFNVKAQKRAARLGHRVTGS